MGHIGLSAIDTNLFVVLDAVLAERSATRAARRLHVTQSAISNALARLRALLGDPLFVRSGRGLVATPFASGLAGPLSSALQGLHALMETTHSFDPSNSERIFTLACTDHQAVTGVPHLAALLERRLPRGSLRVVTPEHVLATNALATGSTDVALAPAGIQASGLHAERIYDEVGTFVVRKDNPRMKGRTLSRSQFETLSHVDVKIIASSSDADDPQLKLLRRLGLKRRVVLNVPHFVAAAYTVSKTDYVAGMPLHLARSLAPTFGLRLVDAPFLPPQVYSMAMVWHERTQADPGARFFREQVRQAFVGAHC